MSKTDKSVWLSGEICDAPAIYFADSCGHQLKKEYRKLDIFGRCPKCHQATRWIRMGSPPAKSSGSYDFAS
jgi:hypothetical protein